MATKPDISTQPQPAPAHAPVTLSKEEVLRYSRHLIMPEVGMEGQLKLKQAKVLCIGTGGLGAPLGLYLAAAGVGRIGLVDFDRVDFTNLQRQILIRHRRRWPPENRSRRRSPARSEPRNSNRSLRNSSLQRKCARHSERLRHHRGWHRQFSHALSCKRRLRPARKAQCLWLDLPLRRSGHHLRLSGWPVLSLLVSRAASSGPRSVLRRRRRAGSSAGNRRLDSGRRNAEADHRQGSISRRPLAALRRSGHAFPRTQVAQKSGLPRLRQESHSDQIN